MTTSFAKETQKTSKTGLDRFETVNTLKLLEPQYLLKKILLKNFIILDFDLFAIDSYFLDKPLLQNIVHITHTFFFRYFLFLQCF